MRGVLSLLLTPLCLLLALPVLGVLAAWFTLDAAALAVLRHQLDTVLPEYALQSAALAFFVGLGVMVLGSATARSSEVLPQPEGPIKTPTWPAVRPSETPSTAARPPPARV